MKRFLLDLITFYQRFISPILTIHFNIHCRHYPSCSEFAKITIEEWGIFRGSLLTALRLLKCNSLFPGGIDFPPLREQSPKEAP
ncbi:MAG: membrane protein insertion efficiency factor YidD [Caldimicrobium sp.]|nr:membrane protein insertion efficiency factor YidD [Caldimicrobium sp.]